MNSRALAEKELIHSLSRYIGYTTGAYRFERFVQILDSLSGKPAIYKFEIIENIRNLVKTGDKPVSEKYAQGVLDFVEALGLISNVAGERGGSLNPKLVKYEISDLGRALRSSVTMNLDDFRDYLIGLALAKQDADIYCLILEFFSTSRNVDLNDYMRRRLLDIRGQRISWINSNVKYKLLRDRIVNQVGWLNFSGKNVCLREDTISASFLRHHVTPRRGWAEEARHLDLTSNKLTEHGLKYFHRLSIDGKYSWIGPGLEVMEQLKFGEAPKNGLVGPPDVLLRQSESSNHSESLQTDHQIEEICHYMISAFPDLKLASANQASVGCIELYCSFLQYRDNYFFVPIDLIEKIIKANPEKLAAISSRSARLGHYQLRSSP